LQEPSRQRPPLRPAHLAEETTEQPIDVFAQAAKEREGRPVRASPQRGTRAGSALDPLFRALGFLPGSSCLLLLCCHRDLLGADIVRRGAVATLAEIDGFAPGGCKARTAVGASPTAASLGSSSRAHATRSPSACIPCAHALTPRACTTSGAIDSTWMSLSELGLDPF